MFVKMPHKISSNEETTPPVLLRRSPRYLKIVLAEPQDPKTPKKEHHRRTRSLSSPAPLFLTGKENISSRRRSRRSKSEKSSEKIDESCNARQTSVRSKKLNRVDECNADKFPRSSDRRNGKLEKRMTRSSCKDLDNTNNGCSSKEYTAPNNKVKHSNKNCDNNSGQFGTLAIKENPVLNEELSKKDLNKNGVDVISAVVVQERPINVKIDVNKRVKNIGAKRKRNQSENNMGIGQSWTKDQELALERAYLVAKPTPHFWKKVSRLVPGKSAQECFDKIHGSHLTPPQPCTRSRPRISKPQNSSLSASKLLKTSSSNRQPRSRKQKSHIIQRTVRHMLQNQYKPNQDSEPDMFSLLEPTFNPILNLNMVLATPDRSQETEDVHKRCSTVKRSVSRFSATLVSPPVLKQVKNKALHEKYIDLLNCREANRKAASVKGEKVNNNIKVLKQGSAERKEAFKAAKNALVFGAKDAIGEFQNQQAIALSDLFDNESGHDDDDEDDGHDDDDEDDEDRVS